MSHSLLPGGRTEIYMKRLICFLAVLALLSASGCGNIDPNVKKTDTEATKTETEIGKTDNGTVPATAETTETGESIPEYIDADALALRSYELRYLMAQEFSSPDEISVNALVQYCFCHLYYENLTDMPRTGSRLRQASPDEIKTEILKQFGFIDADITKADLYNSGRQCFEMWEPLYGTDVFYDVTVSRASENTYSVSTTFYTDSLRKEILGKTVLTAEDSSGQVRIKKLTSSK